MPAAPSPPYILILDDHPLVGRGMAHYLQAVRPDLGVHLAATLADAQSLMLKLGCPVMMVADIWLADGNSLQAQQEWKARYPALPWLAISGDDDPSIIQRVRAAGAHGFVHKQAAPEIFGRAFSAVLAGDQWFTQAPAAGAEPQLRQWQVSPAELGLTTRQGEILILLLRGLSNKRIALALEIAESTVKEHATAIFERLGVRSRVEAITALRGRQVSPD